jgi:nucleotide-binding universal stress UspA family protein
LWGVKTGRDLCRRLGKSGIGRNFRIIGEERIMVLEQAQCDTRGSDVKHVMIAVDTSDNAKRAVLFVGDFLGCYERMRVTLLLVILEPEATFFRDNEVRQAWLAEKQEEARKVMEEYRDILLAAGFADDKVSVRVDIMQASSVADCILKAQEELKCSVIVIGRRGISKKEEFIFGSTSNRIIHEAQNCAVLVIE